MQNYDEKQTNVTTAGQLRLESYFLNRNLHRTDGPALISYWDSGKPQHCHYYINGIPHRDNGPAYIGYDVENRIETLLYRHHGLIHRIDGPAIIRYNSFKIRDEEYSLNGKRCYIDLFVDMMRASKNKTDTLMGILNENRDQIDEMKILFNMFRTEIEPSVGNNLDFLF